MPKLTLGFSPCPNDTFIFDALVNGKIDTGDIEFEVVLEDVAELNKKAFSQTLDITKLSYHAFAHLLPHYELLHAGSALGNNCGPLLIARQPISPEDIPNCTIAIPGQYTTANFLLGLAFPTATQKKIMLFSDIEKAVLDGKVDIGLIIHENRFTYQDKGLVKLMDLGEYWETATKLPIPLGGIVIKRNIPYTVKHKVDNLLQESVQYAFNHPKGATNYMKQYAQEMSTEIMFQHVDLYVNKYSLALGEVGQKAIQHLFNVAQTKKIIPKFAGNIILNKA